MKKTSNKNSPIDSPWQMELPYSTAIFYLYIIFFFFWATFSDNSDFPQQVKNYFKKSTTSIPISGQRECVNTVHRPEENPKQNLYFSIGNVYWRQMKIVTSESSLLNETHTNVCLCSRPLCHTALVKMAKVKYTPQHSNEVGLAANGRGKAYFFCFVFSFCLDKVLLRSYM